jgi:hypothetical protein
LAFSSKSRANAPDFNNLDNIYAPNKSERTGYSGAMEVRSASLGYCAAISSFDELLELSIDVMMNSSNN